MSGTLYIVATPIGNLGDITFRAVEILKAVDLIACEDTRHTKVLLSKYNITRPLISYFEHNKLKRSKQLIELLSGGKKIALVSDAGTPGISDPGFRIIRDAIDNNIEVSALPGASAMITALVLSGEPTDRFVFEGFLPNKTNARRNRLSFFKDEKRTIVFYESPHRLIATLEDIKEVLGDIRISCTREATKKFEETKRERVSLLLDYFRKKGARGEFVLVFNLRQEKR